MAARTAEGWRELVWQAAQGSRDLGTGEDLLTILAAKTEVEGIGQPLVGMAVEMDAGIIVAGIATGCDDQRVEEVA